MKSCVSRVPAYNELGRMLKFIFNFCGILSFVFDTRSECSDSFILVQSLLDINDKNLYTN